MGIRLATGATAALALAAAAPAPAATVSLPVDSTGMHRVEFRAHAGEANRVSFTPVARSWRFEDPGAPLSPGENCVSEGPNAVLCSPGPNTGVQRPFVFDLGDGDDELVFEQLVEVKVNAGPGDDHVSSTQVKMDVDGGPGADRIHGYVNSRISYADRKVGVRLIQDGLANDGEPGEGDNVTGRFSRVEGGAGDDELHLVEGQCCGLLRNSTLDGHGGDDRLFGSGSSDQIRGGEGDDELYGLGGEIDWLTGGPGGDLIRGGDGRDSALGYGEHAPVSITLDDQFGDGVAGENDNVGSDVEGISGTPFDDLLIGTDADNGIHGGGGNDVIDGRGGNDGIVGSGSIVGGTGEDTISTGDFPQLVGGDWIPLSLPVLTTISDRDRYTDTITCAPGNVRLRIDPDDALRLCAPVVVGPRPERYRVARDGTVRMRMRCATGADVPCAGGRVYVHRGGEGGAVVGRARFSLPAKGRSAVVAVRLTSGFRRELRRARALRAAFQVVTYRTAPGPRNLEKFVPRRTLLGAR